MPLRFRGPIRTCEVRSDRRSLIGFYRRDGQLCDVREKVGEQDWVQIARLRYDSHGRLAEETGVATRRVWDYDERRRLCRVCAYLHDADSTLEILEEYDYSSPYAPSARVESETAEMFHLSASTSLHLFLAPLLYTGNTARTATRVDSLGRPIHRTLYDREGVQLLGGAFHYSDGRLTVDSADRDPIEDISSNWRVIYTNDQSGRCLRAEIERPFANAVQRVDREYGHSGFVSRERIFESGAPVREKTYSYRTNDFGDWTQRIDRIADDEQEERQHVDVFRRHLTYWDRS